ncbi:unnamed protein product [Fraxinus pennsylvanica]|uniref:Uncharacterized protein n=1 Tax=Fraxinus pennsylvanica TaxID=56036 RepID=A0AAD2EBK3_9LAMI|nr:unnamed protein product [Fraxinus pennsylvanica]
MIPGISGSSSESLFVADNIDASDNIDRNLDTELELLTMMNAMNALTMDINPASINKGSIYSSMSCIRWLQKVRIEEEFKAEVTSISRTNHKNLVQFMSNGSLANFLFENSRPNWDKRPRIAFATIYLVSKFSPNRHSTCSNTVFPPTGFQNFPPTLGFKIFPNRHRQQQQEHAP